MPCRPFKLSFPDFQGRHVMAVCPIKFLGLRLNFANKNVPAFYIPRTFVNGSLEAHGIVFAILVILRNGLLNTTHYLTGMFWDLRTWTLDLYIDVF
jgi:hypothetical protein